MTPISLTISAFGPFAATQKIDFTAFQDDRLFLVSGKTGSGKTTIFDAISFCLFGEASGSARPSDSFKSQFSKDTDECSVSFEFVVKGSKYTVLRNPKQIHITRSGSISEKASTALLTKENGECVSGANAVSEYIESLLGINANQFKKIVMLPQGEFRKFLSDDSSEKQKILRKIFNTEVLQHLVEDLKQDTASLKSLIDDLMIKYTTVLGTVEWTNQSDKERALAASTDFGYIISLIETQNKAVSKQIEQHKGNACKLRHEKEKLNLPYHEEINRKFNRLSEANNKLNELKSRAGEIEKEKNALKLFKAVKDILPIYESYCEISSQLLQTKTAKAEYGIRLDEAKKKQTSMTAQFKECEKEKANIPGLIAQTENLKQQQKQLALYLSLINSKKQKNETLSKCKKRLLALEQHKLCISLESELFTLKNQISMHMKLQQHITSYHSLVSQLNKASAYYKKRFTEFIDGQSASIAKELKDNQPCPVCGSLAHPSPASFEGELVSQDSLDLARAEYEAKIESVEKTHSECMQIIAFLNASDRFDCLNEYLQWSASALNEMNAGINELSDKISKIDIDGSMAKGSDTLETVKSELAAAATECAVVESDLAGISERLSQLCDTNFESISEEDLSLQINSIERKTAEIQTKHDNSAKELSQITAEAARLEEAFRQATLRLEELDELCIVKKETYVSMLEKADINEERFIKGKENIGKISAYEKSIANYNEDIASANAVAASMTAELEGKTPVNILTLQAENSAIVEKMAIEDDSIVALSSLLSSNSSACAKLKALQKSHAELTLKHSKAFKLSSAANGDLSEKVDFERYVLAVYFDEVIENANLRLDKMTSARYLLYRRLEREKGNKSSGLALEVFDSYTGKMRHTNTLSGGESFKLALALAMGLADIISEHSGGIELNTLFIDEGFDSLDTNSLELAVECLQELRLSGRYIGIISHVSELKDKIPSKILVHSLPTGSYIEQ